jgi:cobalt-zinc-cadmium efflux system protein
VGHHHHHGPHGHAHGHAGAPGGGDRRPEQARALRLTLGLTAGLVVAEVVGGLLTGSIALIADAGHMLSDSASLALALVAIRLARRPATPARSFGLARAEILAALLNGAALVAVGLWVVVTAALRLDDPPEVLGGWVLVVALAGLAVNVAGTALLWRSRGDSLNVEAAFRHVLADLAGSIGVIVAALVIITTGWRQADALAAIAIGLLILASSWSVLRDATRVLLEAAPAGLDVEGVGRRMVAQPGVREVHDLHVWTITSGFPALSAHVLVGPGEDCHARRRELERMLGDEFAIGHTTLQVDHTPRPIAVRASGAGPAADAGPPERDSGGCGH